MNSAELLELDDEPLPEPPPIPELNRAYLGDCIATMKSWPSEFVDAIVTSPPYFAQRSYLPKDHPDKDMEIGCGQDIDDYLESLLWVFAQCRRILKPHGTLWINLGDTYDSCKNLMGVPWQLALKLKRENWILRQCVIWEKPNVLPAPADDRPTTSHEYVFQFARSMRPYFDWYAARETRPPKKNQKSRDDGGDKRPRSVWSIPTVSLNGRKLMADFKDEHGIYREIDPECPYHGTEEGTFYLPLFRTMNPRAKLECSCKPVHADFFAAMPPDLAARCIALSTSEMGNCASCGSPYNRILKKERVATRPGRDVKVDDSGKSHKDPGRHVTHIRGHHWEPSCKCDDQSGYSAPIAFDPFLGSGTTALAATLLGRNWLGCELNEMLVNKLIPARLRLATKG